MIGIGTFVPRSLRMEPDHVPLFPEQVDEDRETVLVEGLRLRPAEEGGEHRASAEQQRDEEAGRMLVEEVRADGKGALAMVSLRAEEQPADDELVEEGPVVGDEQEGRPRRDGLEPLPAAPDNPTRAEHGEGRGANEPPPGQ